MLGLFLYGSVLRDDFRIGSDVDLLCVIKEGKISSCENNGLNIVYYPLTYLLKMANKGDLFIYHLIKDAQAIYQEFPIVEDLKDEFRFKDDYKIEILYGIKLAEALNVSEVGPFKFNNKEYVKSMFYALRKVLYSVYYIDEDFSFSLEAILSKAGFNDSEILNFVQVKHTSNFDLSFVSLVVNTVRTYKYLVEDISDYRSINEEKILSKKIKLAFSENPSQTEMYT